uniref:Uncharacterized protein n=1 Tax=Solanum tuberosum TaxID=4113 RepID=M0ZYM2_SOLTU
MDTTSQKGTKRLKERRNEGLRIAESTWRVAEGSYFAFCSSVLTPEGKDQVGGKREQSAHRREVPRSSTMSPNDPEDDDTRGWCKTICAGVDHSASLVEIADQLGDSPFGVVHRSLAPAFSIVLLWVIG